MTYAVEVPRKDEIHDDSRKVLVLEVWHRQRGYR
jgi:hypothetical protein